MNETMKTIYKVNVEELSIQLVPPVPAPPLWSGGMYWWYLSFLILGLVSLGFRGRGRWLKFREEGREEEQVGLGGRAVCKDT